MTSKKALVTGITGQDGSYMAELLLEKGYDVYGIIRKASLFNTGRIDHLYKDVHEVGNRLHLIHGDLADANTIYKIVKKVQPDEIYHLGAQSHVRVSFEVPEYTGDITGMGTLRILEAMRDVCPSAKFYFAGSSEMFGKAIETPQNESTPFNPRSPYACAKVYGFNITKNYREAYQIFACNGILFNHESPRRNPTFITRKITQAFANIKYNRQKHVYIGNLNAKRDWGYAPEYVKAMWLMLQQKEPDDYVVATGEAHSVREFLHEAHEYAGLEGDAEQYVKIDTRYFRPTEVDLLLGDASKVRKKLGWEPKVRFKELVKLMVNADMEHVRRETEGFAVKEREKKFEM